MCRHRTASSDGLSTAPVKMKWGRRRLTRSKLVRALGSLRRSPDSRKQIGAAAHAFWTRNRYELRNLEPRFGNVTLDQLLEGEGPARRTPRLLTGAERLHPPSRDARVRIRRCAHVGGRGPAAHLAQAMSRSASALPSIEDESGLATTADAGPSPSGSVHSVGRSAA